MIATLAALALFASVDVDRTPLSNTLHTPEQAPVTRTSSDAEPVLQSVAVTVECTAFADGRIGECSVLGETHPGLGFGEAAIALMRDAITDRSTADYRFARTIQFMP